MKLLTMAFIILIFSGIAQAGSAYVCKSKSVPIDHKGNFPVLSNETIFVCGDGVKGTIPKLAAEGWSIIQVMAQEDTEKDDGIYQELLIQKSGLDMPVQ